MATTAWPSTLVTADFAADAPCTTTHATELRDRGQVLLTAPWETKINGNVLHTDSPAYERHAIQILEHWLGATLHIGIKAQIAVGGTGEGRAWIRLQKPNATDVLTGAKVSFTAISPLFDELDLLLVLTSATLSPLLDDFGATNIQNGRINMLIEVEDVSGTGAKQIFSADMMASYVEDA